MNKQSIPHFHLRFLSIGHPDGSVTIGHPDGSILVKPGVQMLFIFFFYEKFWKDFIPIKEVKDKAGNLLIQ